jgi:hypothetical protein
VSTPSLWDHLVSSSSRREARVLGCFLECWTLSARRLGRDPSSDELVAEWGYTPGEVSFHLKTMHRLFPGRLDEILHAVRDASDSGLGALRSLQVTSGS